MRPEKWPNIKDKATTKLCFCSGGFDVSSDSYFEAGADAMLEGLKAKGIQVKAGEPHPQFRDLAYGNGTWFFIPEEESIK